MRGFTLVEMLAAAVILSFLVVISVSIISITVNSARDKAYQTQISRIESAARNWGAENIALMPKKNESITLYLWVLKKANLIEESFVNQKIEEEFNNDLEILIENTKSGYTYTVLEDSGTKTSIFNRAMPSIILKAKSYEKIEINSFFNDGGVTLLDNDNKILNTYTTKYYLNNVEVPKVDTADEGVYTVKYTITYQSATYELSRKVEVKDTIPPVIAFPNEMSNELVLDITEVAEFNDDFAMFMDFISVTDNSNKPVQTVYSGRAEEQIGEYDIIVTATDFYRNISTKIIKVRVADVYSDETGPTVSFSVTSGATPKKQYSVLVTITDSGSGVHTQELAYAWSTSTEEPDYEYFKPLDSSTKTIFSDAGLTGTYYLWIAAADNNDNFTIVKTDAFILDNTPPELGTLSQNSTANPTGCPTLTITASGTATDPNGMNPNYFYKVGFDPSTINYSQMSVNQYSDYIYFTKCTKTATSCVVAGKDIVGATTYPHMVCMSDLAGNMTCTNTKTITTNSATGSWDCTY